MKRLHIFCEGQTEEVFVREVLYDHFRRHNVSINPIVVRTSESGKGGTSTYGKIKHQIDKKCKEDKTSFVTTLLDFYGLPKDFPDFQSSLKHNVNTFQQALSVEKSFQSDINHPNFIANLMIHEFEGILFSKPAVFDRHFEEDCIQNLINDISPFASPEHINNGPDTAPSKRIVRYYPHYHKVVDGVIIAQEIGLDDIRSRCLHFNNWIERLEILGANES